MKHDVMFTFKLMFVVVLMVAVQLICAFVMTTNIRSNLNKNRNATTVWNSEALASSFEGTLTADYSRAKVWKAGEDGFEDSAALTGDILVFSDGTSVKPDVNLKKNLGEKDLNVLRLSELRGAVVGTDEYLFVYGFSEGNSRRLVMQKQSQFLEGIASFGFASPMLVSESGRILAGEFAGGYLTDRTGLKLSDLLGEETIVVTADWSGEKSFVASASFVFGNVKLYSSGVLNVAEIEAQISAETSKSMLIVALMCVISAALMMIVVLLFLFRDRKFRMSMGTEYELICDEKGNILKSNHVFKTHFERTNVYDDSPAGASDDLEDGTSMVLPIIDALGHEHMVTFLVSRHKDHYKVVGHDTTMKKTSDEIRGEGMQRSVDLQSDYKILAAKNNRFILGVIEIVNLSTLETMFGKQFCEKVYFSVSEKVKKRFSSFYAMIPDQIGVLLTDSKDTDDLMRDLPQIMDDLNRPVRIEENLINANCRAGFAIVDMSMQNRDCMYAMTCVNAARRKAVGEERQTFFVYHETQRKQYEKYFEKTCDIQKMLQNNSFELEFQPQFSLKTNKVCGFESLFRVKKHLTLEMNTQELIEYAERSGSMIYLGNFIFSEGMKFAKSIEGKGVTVSLNVSPVQFMQAGFVANFLNLYREFKLAPNSICVEITETFLMTNFDETLAKLRLLQKERIDVHLDDFGVSYSSLLYLKKLPINALKIDREFVSDMTKDETSRSITQFIVNLAKELKLFVISEGVETEPQRAMLAKMGCDAVQGYLTGRSMPADSARELVLGKPSEAQSKPLDPQ